MNEQHRDVLKAAMERILPRDREPGATDANAIAYVDWAMRQAASEVQRYRWETGLQLLDDLALTMWRKPFPSSDPAEQDAVLGMLQRVPHPTIQSFFVGLVRVTLAGFLCAPRYGGNRNLVGWRFIGFVPHPVTLGNKWEGPECRQTS